MPIFTRCLALFVLTLIVDLTQTIHIQACADRRIALSVSSILVVYILNFWGKDWFIKYDTTFARWMFTIAGALGAGVGTSAAIYIGG